MKIGDRVRVSDEYVKYAVYMTGVDARRLWDLRGYVVSMTDETVSVRWDYWDEDHGKCPASPHVIENLATCD